MSSRQAWRRRVAAACAAQREKIAGYSGRSARTLYSRSQNSAVYFIASSCLPVGEGCAVYPLHGALGRRPLRSVKWQAWGRSSAGRASRSQCEGRGFDPLRLHQSFGFNLQQVCKRHPAIVDERVDPAITRASTTRETRLMLLEFGKGFELEVSRGSRMGSARS